jgi:hypothetical protein
MIEPGLPWWEGGDYSLNYDKALITLSISFSFYFQ